MNGRLLTIDQVAEYMSVHRDTVYNLIRSGRLPALQLGGRKAGWRISEDDVLEFVRAGKANQVATNGSEENDLAEFDRHQDSELEDFRDVQRQRRDEFVSDQAGKHTR